MNFDFLVPSAAFALAVAIVGLLERPEDSATNEARAVRVILPALIVSVLAWFVWRLVATQFGGAAVTLPHLVNGNEGGTTQEIPWQGVVYFCAMILGMAAHTTWEILPKSRRSKAVSFDKWRYARPALVAPIIFLAVWKLVGVQPFGIESVLLSFQNGFFWQTVMSERS